MDVREVIGGTTFPWFIDTLSDCDTRPRKYSDQEFSVVDCASFVVAKMKKIREVFGFDSDFAKMGFILRP
jgi:hypothetical protein